MSAGGKRLECAHRPHRWLRPRRTVGTLRLIPSPRASEATMPERDLIGYGAAPPRVRWPNDARIAISLVVNYEEGSENLLQDGIGRREMMGESMSPVPPDRRDLANESFFEYGSRAGVWRFLRIFRKHDVRVTFFACAVALERSHPTRMEVAVSLTPWPFG